jgi:hypothetical protein
MITHDDNVAEWQREGELAASLAALVTKSGKYTRDEVVSYLLSGGSGYRFIRKLRNAGIDAQATEAVAKAAKAGRGRGKVGFESLASAIAEHALDILDRKRRLHGFEKAERDSTMKHDSLERIAKDGGVIAICKALVAGNDAHGVSETKLTELITAEAMRDNPGLTGPQAFSKVYTAPTTEGEIVRRAIRVSKEAGWLSDTGSPTGMQFAKQLGR